MLTNKNSITRNKNILTNKNSITRNKNILTNKNSITRNKNILTNKNSITRNKNILTNKNSITRNKNILTNKNSITRNKNILTNKNSITRNKNILTIKNTLSGNKEEFIPLKKGHVSMYVCGPTVYGPGHIGHARTYVAFDIIRKYLEFLKYDVNYVVNITDVHDDMIKQALKEKTDIFKLGDKYANLFFEDMQKLLVKKASAHPRVTQVVNEIVNAVKDLIEKGYAYETEDGVYYNIRKFKGYGKLSKIKLKDAKTGTRVQTDKYDKSNPQDFALWKKAKEGEPSWDSPWGKGRPGWHIECSVMNCMDNGDKIDIHCGAVDLIFPHHENEIAQSESLTGKEPFVKYWMHSGFLNVEGTKMSKSLGNFIKIPELLKIYDPKDFRFFIATLHYRSRIDFSSKNMQKAQNTLAKLNEFLSRVNDVEEDNKNEFELESYKEKFHNWMKDDFNFPNAWAELFSLIKEVNLLIDSNKLGKSKANKILDFFKEIDTIFDIFTFPEKIKLTKAQEKLIKKREELRKKGDYKKSDELRKELENQGILLLDRQEGTIVRKK